jgi:hypothetical protein
MSRPRSTSAGHDLASVGQIIDGSMRMRTNTNCAIATSDGIDAPSTGGAVPSVGGGLDGQDGSRDTDASTRARTTALRYGLARMLPSTDAAMPHPREPGAAAFPVGSDRRAIAGTAAALPVMVDA